MSFNYNELAKKYDLTRSANIGIINLFAEEISLNGKVILDYGCGTGNFAYAIQKLTAAKIYGVEPSDGMREKAIAKGGIVVKKGDHTHIPYEDCFFDFVYMTDVIHHVPDLNMMFAEIGRVMKPDGFICILTESHKQLETRWWVKHFPTTVDVEKHRYPDILHIIQAAATAGLCAYKTVTTDAEQEIVVTEEFIKLAENKGYSMFHLIDEADYQKGLAALKADFENNIIINSSHGETLVWLRKGGTI